MILSVMVVVNSFLSGDRREVIFKWLIGLAGVLGVLLVAVVTVVVGGRLVVGCQDDVVLSVLCVLDIGSK